MPRPHPMDAIRQAVFDNWYKQTWGTLDNFWANASEKSIRRFIDASKDFEYHTRRMYRGKLAHDPGEILRRRRRMWKFMVLPDEPEVLSKMWEQLSEPGDWEA